MPLSKPDVRAFLRPALIFVGIGLSARFAPNNSFDRMRHVAPVFTFADRAWRRLRKRIETAMRLSGAVPHMSAQEADAIGVTQPDDHRSSYEQDPRRGQFARRYK